MYKRQELGLSDKFEVYEPQLIRDDQKVQNGNTEVHRIYEYTIIPHATGQQTVPAVSLPYFDPVSYTHLVPRELLLAFW